MLFSMQLFEKLDVGKSRAADDRAGWGGLRLCEKLALTMTRAGEAAGKSAQDKRDLAPHQTDFARAIEGGRVDVEFHAQTKVLDLRIPERMGQVVDGSTPRAIV